MHAMFRIAHMATPAPLDAVVAMRSESRTGPRAMATVIFSFCFFEMPVFVCRTADRPSTVFVLDLLYCITEPAERAHKKRAPN